MTTQFIENVRMYSKDTADVGPWYIDSHGQLNGTPTTIHRITASNQSLVSSKFVQQDQYVGRYIKFNDITGSVNLPLACVHVKSMYFTGQVIAAVTNNLDHGMLLANDFAQDAALAFKDFKDTVIRRDIDILKSDI